MEWSKTFQRKVYFNEGPGFGEPMEEGQGPGKNAQAPCFLFNARLLETVA